MDSWHILTEEEIKFLKDDPERKKDRMDKQRKSAACLNNGVQKTSVFKRPKPVSNNCNKKLKKSLAQMVQNGALSNVSLQKVKESSPNAAPKIFMPHDFSAELEWIRKDLEERAKKKPPVDYTKFLVGSKGKRSTPSTSSIPKIKANNVTYPCRTLKSRKKLSLTPKPTPANETKNKRKINNGLKNKNETPSIKGLSKTGRKLSLRNSFKEDVVPLENITPTQDSENEFLEFEKECGIKSSTPCPLCPKYEALLRQVMTLEPKLRDCLSELNGLKQKLNGMKTPAVQKPADLCKTVLLKSVRKETGFDKAVKIYNAEKKKTPYLCTPKAETNLQNGTPEKRKEFSVKLQKQIFNLYDTPRK